MKITFEEWLLRCVDIAFDVAVQQPKTEVRPSCGLV